MSDFKRNYKFVEFNIKFDGVNVAEVEELAQYYESGTFHCINTLKSEQVITGYVGKVNKQDLTAKASLISCKKILLMTVTQMNM